MAWGTSFILFQPEHLLKYHSVCEVYSGTAAAAYQVSYKFQPLVYCWFLEGSFRILVKNEVLK